jgi:hypothetical protein
MFKMKKEKSEGICQKEKKNMNYYDMSGTLEIALNA